MQRATIVLNLRDVKIDLMIFFDRKYCFDVSLSCLMREPRC